MKKSIVAMLSITALVTVANADEFSGTNGIPFEAGAMTPGSVFNMTHADNGVTGQGPYYWYAEREGVSCTEKFGEYTNTSPQSVSKEDRPAAASLADTTVGCLALDTEGGRLYRRIIGTNDYNVSSFTPCEITTNKTIYFDSLVQFTVNEDDEPAMQDGDKLAVWLKGGDNGTTNLMITAGFFDVALAEQDYVGASNYVVQTESIEAGTWYRLTIEAVPLLPEAAPGEGYLGFYVYINGTRVTASQPRVYNNTTISNFLSEATGVPVAQIDNENELFPSLVPFNKPGCTSLSCAGFEGTGSIDDLTFTDTNPFAVAPSANPTVDGTPLDPADVFFTNGVAAARTDRAITYPSAPVLSGEVGSQKITFGGVEVNVPEYYTATLVNTVITLALNTNAIPAIAAATVESEAKEAIEVDAATFTATLDSTYPNLYYGLKVASAPNAAEADWTAGELTQGTGAAMQISADKPKDGSDPLPAGFFKVYVTDIPPASAGE